MSPVWVAGLVLIFSLAALTRLVAIFDDFWFDEIWSLVFAANAESPLEIIALAHDNNHFLNTFYLYLLGERASWVPYRLLSLAAGLGTVGLAVRIGLRSSRGEALAAGLVFSTSFLMIVYSSEARGYAPAVFFTLAAFAGCEHWLDGEGGASFLWLWGLVLLGFASHLSFGHFYLALLLWSVWRVLSQPASWRRRAARLAKLHALPLTAVAALYLGVVRRIAIGGGPEWSLRGVLGETLSWSLGLPVEPAWMVLAGLFTAVVVVADAIGLRREGSDLWVLSVGAIAGVPALGLFVLEPDLLFPRYFLVPIALFLLALARVAGRLASGSRGAAAACAALLALVCAGNLARTVPFLRHGRGQYRAALEYMAQHTAAAAITVGSDHADRNKLVLAFYQRYLDPPRAVVYYADEAFPAEGSEWFLVHDQEPTPKVAASLRHSSGHRYALAKIFPHSGPSGWHWMLYRRSDP